MYQLVFQGECTPGTDPQTARANAMALFKASLDQVDRMFSGRRVVLRNKLDEAQAEKYREVLTRHGMVVSVEPMEAAAKTTSTQEREPQPESPQQAREPVRTEPRPETAPSVELEPGDRLPVAGEKVDEILSGSGLRVDQAHERLTEEHTDPTPIFEHMDDWTIAPPGTTLVENQHDIPAAVPDISHLSLEDPPEDGQET